MRNEFDRLHEQLLEMQRSNTAQITTLLLEIANLEPKTPDYTLFFEALSNFIQNPQLQAHHATWTEKSAYTRDLYNIIGSITIDKTGRVMVQRNDENEEIIRKERERLQAIADKVFPLLEGAITVLKNLSFLNEKTIGAISALSREQQMAVTDQAASLIGSRATASLQEKK